MQLLLHEHASMLCLYILACLWEHQSVLHYSEEYKIITGKWLCWCNSYTAIMSKCIMLTEMMMIITVIYCGEGAVITCLMV